MVSVQVGGGGGGDGDNLKEETLRDFVRVVVEGVVELREGVGVDEWEEVDVFFLRHEVWDLAYEGF